MTVRDALEKIGLEWGNRFATSDALRLAPCIERALRAAYLEACLDDDSRKMRDSNHGVTAGVAAMVEKS